MWCLLYVGIFVATVIGLCRRYLTWCVSKLLARHLKCKSVRLGGFGLFRIDNVKLVIRDGLSIEIHDFRMSSSFFNQAHRKPIMFTAADLRVESAAALFPGSALSRMPMPSGNHTSLSASDNLARMMQWLQYIGVKVHTSNVVLLDAVPDCLVHITFEGVSFETYLDRKGLQVELLCKLIQMKLFLRKTVDAMLLDVSVAGSASVDIADSTGKLKKLGVALKNPRIVVSDGIIDYFNAHSIRRISTNASSVVSLSSPKREKPFIRLLKRTPNINFDIDNLTFQFVAALNVESARTLSLSVSKFKTQLDTGLQTASVELTDCAITDHGAASHFRGHLLSATIEPQLIARYNVAGMPPPFPASAYKASIQVYTPFVVLYRHDLAWWLDYARAPHLGAFFAKSSTESAKCYPSTATPSEDAPEASDMTGEQLGRVLIEAEVTDLQCQLRHAEGGSAVVFGIDLATLTADQALQEVEFGVESLWCHHAAAKPVNERLTLDFEKHAWGTTIAIGAGLAKFTQSSNVKPQRLLCIQLDECQFEWEEQVVGLIVDFVKSVIRKDLSEHKNKADLKPNAQKKGALVVQMSARRLDLFFTAKKAAFLACSVANWKLESSTAANSLVAVVEQVRLVQGELRIDIPDLPLNWPTMAADALGQLLLAHAGGCERLVLQLSNNQECRECVTRFEASVELIWSPLAYVVFFEVFDKVRKIAASLKPVNSTETQSNEHDHTPRRVLTIISDYPVEFGFRLPQNHLMRWVVPAISFIKVDNIIDLLAPTFHLAIDDHMIFGLEAPRFQKLAVDSRMDMGRQEFRTLHNKTNKLWWWHADVLQIVFPYGYDFAAAYEEVINSVKWMKLVHGVEPKPFTIESPMWSDLKVTIKSASMRLNDDPFEVQLQTIYEVMMDEIFERERRRQILEEKIQLLLRDDPLFPKSKIDALYQKLASKDAQIYVDRVRQVQQPGAHRQLFLWSIKDFELHTFADMSLHGKDNVVKQMHLVNPEAQLNPDYMNFSTLWGRAVELDIAESKMQFRDYPLPYMNIKEAYYWGTICAAEHLAGDRSIREQYVDLPEPWGTYKINRNMCPLKFYYDLYCEITDFQSYYGPCWEPCLTMISLCWNNVNSPSKDLSPVLPFWDKIRLLIHGRYSMLCKKLSTTLLASPDPYNETELMDIVWEQFGFDWVNAQFRITSAVSIFVRTASKYDDSKLLHLPTFKCGINLEWACLGPANDHHSVTPVAPHKLPEYSTNVEHDSYRCFRSSHLDIAMNIDVKGAEDDVRSTKGFPQVLMYANTIKWFDFLKNTMTMVNRSVKRGPLFGVPHVKKQQLSRHLRRLHLTATLPRFMITYWMSSSSLSHGFRFFCKSLQLVFAVDLKVSPYEVQDGIRRRSTMAWKTSLFSVQLEDAQLRLYGASCQPEADDFDPSLEDSRAFFLGLSRMSYNRETTGSLDWNLRNNAQAILEAARLRPAVHRITVHDLRASWTIANRDTCLAIMDGLQKAHLLKSVLGQDAMKILDFAETSMPATVQTGRGNRTSDDTTKSPARHAVPLHHTLSNANGSEDGGASSLLAQLVEEAKTNLVAYSEDTIEPPTDALHGVVLSGKNDVIQAQWQIDLLNSQVVLNGCEKDGFIVMTASRASLTQRVHLPVWRNAQLLLKKSWTAMLSGMQYFAPLVIGRSATVGREQFRWLSKDVIEDHVVDATVNDKLNNFSATGEAVGGVVTDSSSQTPRLSPGPQLQRVASRCSCQMFFISFADILNTEEFEKALIPQIPDSRHEAKWGEHQADVDCFTLKHNMLEVCTNSEQYQIILDCVNNLVLFVDPKKKLSEENRRRRWFELGNIAKEDIRAKIQAMQSELREVVAILRSLERQAFFHNRQIGNGVMTVEEEAELKRDMEIFKAKQLRLTDKLAMTISCFKERAMEERSEKHRRQAMQHDDEQALIARRFEVCFEDCTWRLTDGDGQLSITEMQIRNFLYTRTARIDSSGEHLLEVGTVKVLNLLPDSKYKETLARLPLSDGTPVSFVEKTPAVRVICREMPPVGGINVKEHFEVNIAPMHAQITYRFFDKMMAFFFPGRNIDKEDQQNLDNSDDVSGHIASTPSGTLASSFSLTRRLRGAVNGSFRTKSTPATDTSGHGTPDEIDKMKERAEKNQVFVYIIIPQVTFVVSYKGNKEKNIEDVDRFTFTFPVCEYHDKNWTWLDLALAVKQRCKRMLLQQFMTQKFLRKPGITDRSTGATAVAPFDEEEKKRILLGTMTPVASKSKK